MLIRPTISSKEAVLGFVANALSFRAFSASLSTELTSTPIFF